MNTRERLADLSNTIESSLVTCTSMEDVTKLILATIADIRFVADDLLPEPSNADKQAGEYV